MRKHLPTFAALAAAACLAFLALGANATPIGVNLSSCTGFVSCTSNGVTLSGWELDNGTWMNAYLVYKNDSNNETGLGVMCNQGFTGPKCGQHEINTIPAQYISVGIGGIKFSSLSIGIGSDDSDGNSSNSTVPETAYIYGLTCANGVCGQGTLLGSHAGSNFPNNAWTFNFTSKQLSGFSFLYVTPLCVSGSAGAPSSCPSAPDANILLASLTYSVPEPAVLGMFGLGLLLIGGFVGLRRRQH